MALDARWNSSERVLRERGTILSRLHPDQEDWLRSFLRRHPADANRTTRPTCDVRGHDGRSHPNGTPMQYIRLRSKVFGRDLRGADNFCEKRGRDASHSRAASPLRSPR